MRFVSVRADAFGPFRPNETLEFAPGMTVVFGPNEAGKSSWHAAMYAGLCGMRRGKGRVAKEDPEADFAERHRPWRSGDAGPWAVTAIVELHDGRRIALRHDLAMKTAAISDATLGRPYDVDLTHDGAPDGALLVGLDRRAFLATACMRQADLLELMHSSKTLQDYLQKAVATGGDDASVTDALSAIDKFFDDSVGSDRKGSQRPWRAAMDALEYCKDHLAEAQRLHAAHQERLVQADELRSRVDASRQALELVQARKAEADAARAEQDLERAVELVARFPHGAPHAAADENEQANAVAGALAAWETHSPEPEAHSVHSGTTADLQEQLRNLPQMPEHDVEEHPSIRAAAEQWRDAVRAYDQHADVKPPVEEAVTTGGLVEAELRTLAHELRLGAGGSDPAIEERYRKAQDAVDAAAQQTTPKLFLGGGVVLIVVGLMLALLMPLAGVPLVVLGGALVAWSVSRNGRNAPPDVAAELKAAKQARGEQQARSESSLRLRQAAMERARLAGLDADPDTMEQLAGTLASAEARQQQRASWDRRHQQLQIDVDQRHDGLASALQARRIALTGDLAADLTRYQEDCLAAERVAVEARRRPDLELQLEARKAADAVAGTAAAQRRQAAGRVLHTVSQCGLTAETPDQAVHLLRGWQARHAARAEALSGLQQAWAELQTLLDGRDVTSLETLACERRAAAEERAGGLAPEDIAAVTLEPDVEQQLERHRDDYSRLATDYAELQGRIQTEATQVPSVPAAEEALGAATVELQRVNRLRETLQLTKEYLAKAQTRVHRNVAPLLAASVSTRLSHVTHGRYADVVVDPQDLMVHVRLPDGASVPAQLLSHGTAEQVYLLLRVAIVERLAKQDEPCPLVMDDITVQSDTQRTTAILETLQTLAGERQIILFTQEDDVLRWAEEHLRLDTVDRLHRLALAESAA